MTMHDIETYDVWKYRILYNRRLIYFPLLSLILILSWSYIYYIINEGILSLQLAIVVPLIICIIHIIILISMFTNWGRIIMNKAQGYRFCLWCGLSLLLTQCFLTVPTTVNTTDKYVLSSFLSAISLTVFHHLGVSQNVTLGFQVFLIILWSVNIWQWEIGSLVSITTFCCLLSLMLASIIQDYEMKRTFKLDTNVKVKQSDVTNVPIIEVTKALQILHENLHELQSLLNKANIASAYVQEENRWYWTPCFASLQESKYYCMAIYTAIRAEVLEKDTVLNHVNQFAFSRICEKLFVVYESIAENSLTLFLDDTASEVFITAPQGLFELVLFLLIQDAVCDPNPGICFIETECIEDAWYMNVTISILDDPLINSTEINSSFVLGSTHDEPDNPFLEGLLPIVEKSKSLNSSFSLRLADIICQKYFQSELTAPEPDYSPDSNLRILKRTFRLPEEGTSVIQGMSSAQYNRVAVRNHWLFIEHVVGDEENVSYLKDKLAMLRVPLAFCPMYQLSKLTEKYRIAVISDSLLIKFHLQLRKDISSVALKLIVICDSKTTPEHFYQAYGVFVTSCISSRATMHEIFYCIQSVTRRLAPRLVVADESKDVLSLVTKNSLVTGRNRQIRSENFKTDEAQPLQCIELITRLQVLSKDYSVDDFTIAYILDGCIQRITNVPKDFIVIPDSIAEEEHINLANMKDERKKVKFVIKVFYPTIDMMRDCLSHSDLVKLLSLVTNYSQKAKRYGFNQLCCLFDILGDFTKIAQLLLSDYKSRLASENAPLLLNTTSISIEKVIRFLQKMIDEIEKNMLDLFRVVR